MQSKDRIVRYKAIEEKRGRPLIVYATSTRPGVGAQMAGDAVREFIDQMDAITGDHAAIDVLIHSTGGDGLTAWKLMSILRERFSDVSVLVPSMAFSAATLFALGANQIVMHPHASLGPIDPQIEVRGPNGSRTFAYEDVAAFLKFLEDDCGLRDQPHVTAILDRLFQTVDPLILGAARRASDLSTSVGERLLRMHLTSPDERDKPAQIARNLNKSFFAHADAVSRTRAQELGLNVAPSEPELERLLWAAYEAIEGYMELRRPFVPLQHFLSDAKAAATLDPVGIAGIPGDATPEVAQQLWNAIAQQVLQRAARSGAKVPFRLVNALIESPRKGSEHVASGYISATRLADGQIRCVTTQIMAAWEVIAAPAVPA